MSKIPGNPDGNHDRNFRQYSDANSDDLVEQLKQKTKELLNIAEQLEKQAKYECGRTVSSLKENKLPLSPPIAPIAPIANVSLPPQPVTEATFLQSFQNSGYAIRHASPAPTHQTLLSKGEYQTCHIRLPGSEKRYPAILVEGDYFSLVRVFPDLESTLAAKAKLDWHGDRAVITQLATGYALWVWEPEATSDLSPDLSPQNNQRTKHDPPLRVVKNLDSQNSGKTDLEEYLLTFNQLSKWAGCYLGTAVVTHYWKSTRPRLAWFARFEIMESGEISCRDFPQSHSNVWQEKQLKSWLQGFIQRCRRVVPDFPQSCQWEDENAQQGVQLLARILDK